MAVLIMLKAPRGILGMIANRYHMQLFGLIRKVKPTEKADD